VCVYSAWVHVRAWIHGDGSTSKTKAGTQWHSKHLVSHIQDPLCTQSQHQWLIKKKSGCKRKLIINIPPHTKKAASCCHHGNAATEAEQWWRSSSCLTEAQWKTPTLSNVSNRLQFNVCRAKFPGQAASDQHYHLLFKCTLAPQPWIMITVLVSWLRHTDILWNIASKVYKCFHTEPDQLSSRYTTDRRNKLIWKVTFGSCLGKMQPLHKTRVLRKVISVFPKCRSLLFELQRCIHHGSWSYPLNHWLSVIVVSMTTCLRLFPLFKTLLLVSITLLLISLKISQQSLTQKMWCDGFGVIYCLKWMSLSILFTGRDERSGKLSTSLQSHSSLNCSVEVNRDHSYQFIGWFMLQPSSLWSWALASDQY